MPSATTKIPRSATMRKLSSFPERMIPTSVRPAQVMCTAPLRQQPVEEGDEDYTRHYQGRRASAAALALLGGGCWAAGRFGTGLGRS